MEQDFEIGENGATVVIHNPDDMILNLKSGVQGEVIGRQIKISGTNTLLRTDYDNTSLSVGNALTEEIRLSAGGTNPVYLERTTAEMTLTGKSIVVEDATNAFQVKTGTLTIDAERIEISGTTSGFYGNGSGNTIVRNGNVIINTATSKDLDVYGIYLNKGDTFEAENLNSLTIRTIGSKATGVQAWGYKTPGSLSVDARSINITTNNDAVWAQGGSSIRFTNENSLVRLTADDSLGAAKDGNSIGIYAGDPSTKIDIRADSVEITTRSAGDAVGILSSTNKLGEETPASVSIDANSVTITAIGTGSAPSTGIAAFGEAEVTLRGNTTISADNALDVRGDSVVSINEGLTNRFTQINGNVAFDYAQNSGTAVDADVRLNLVGTDSYWKGSPILLESIPIPEDKPELAEVTGMKLNLSDGARWEPTMLSEDVTNAELIAVNDLTLENGVVDLVHGADQTVRVENLLGSGGEIRMRAATEDGLSFTSGRFVVQNAAPAEAAPKLAVTFTGVTADDVKDADKTFESLKDAVKADGTEQVRVIEEGRLKGELQQSVAADGTLGDVVHVENLKLASFESFAAVSALAWRQDMNAFAKRTALLRDSKGSAGAWAALDGAESEYGDQGLTSKRTAIRAGADTKLDDLTVGFAFDYANADGDFDVGTGDQDAFGVAAYGLWQKDALYADVSLRYARLENDFAVRTMEADYANDALALTSAVGYRFALAQSRVFVEPELGLSYGIVFGDDFRASNGVKVAQEDFESLIGRAGVRAGFTFPNESGSVFARLGGAYDFLGDADATASTGEGSVRLHEALGGGWLEMGVGARFDWTDATYGYVELERTNGGRVRDVNRWQVGVRHAF